MWHLSTLLPRTGTGSVYNSIAVHEQFVYKQPPTSLPGWLWREDRKLGFFSIVPHSLDGTSCFSHAWAWWVLWPSCLTHMAASLAFASVTGSVPPAKDLSVYSQGQNFALSSPPALHVCEIPIASFTYPSQKSIWFHLIVLFKRFGVEKSLKLIG